MDIGQLIKAARLKKGYTQEELGKLIGVQKSAVAKYEKGRIVNIKRSVLAKLASELEIPPIDLVSDIQNDPIKTANDLAAVVLDSDLMSMVSDYNMLNEKLKEEAREYIRYLLTKNN